MSKSKYSIFAICVLALSLTVAGCSQGNSEEDAQARVNAAKAELQDAQAALKAQNEQAGDQEDVNDAKAELKQAKAELRAERASNASSRQSRPEPKPVCGDCGTISAITEHKVKSKRSSPGGVVGGVLGAVAGVAVGNQIGSGSGKDIARVVGGLGGAAAGNEIGRRVDADTYYAVSVNMDAGGSRTINVPDATGLSVGQDVKVQGGNIVLQ